MLLSVFIFDAGSCYVVQVRFGLSDPFMSASIVDGTLGTLGALGITSSYSSDTSMFLVPLRTQDIGLASSQFPWWNSPIRDSSHPPTVCV